MDRAAPRTQGLAALDPAQFARLSALLDDALDRDAAGRAAFVADLAPREPALAAQLAGLLAAHAAATAEGLLETPDFGPPPAMAGPDAAPETVGRSFGPYRVLRLLGHGGMGIVWLAERADGLFDRQVALKLLQPGLVGTAASERFARERAIVGALDHPNIARLLDAGVGPEGQPYLALEYVDGTPIDRHCDAARLDVTARVAILLQALDAVQYAHAHLVVHRDLKPSNMLVDRDGRVKLLDFGIAKLLSESAAGDSALTALAGQAFTPDYAAPEQIAGGTITTASDVHALGVVLYELLCGRRPFAGRRDTRAALEDAIVTDAASRPSATAIDPAIAAARATTSRGLAQRLAGDLDTIVQKALRKDPAQRYPSVEAFAEDLRRHLDGRPVLARPDGFAYRASRFVRRNRLPVAAAAAVVAALAVGLAVALWQAGVARTQAAAARSEAARATAVQDFLLGLFRANSIDQPDAERARRTTAQELLDRGARAADDALAGAPDARVAVLGTLADMHYQIGMTAEAARLRKRAVDAARLAFGAADPRLADALMSYASDVNDLPERGDVLPALDEAQKILDAAHDDGSEARGRLLMLYARAYRYGAVESFRDYADRAVAFLRARYPDSRQLSQALTYAAQARAQRGEYVESIPYYRQALENAERHEGPASAWSVFPQVALAETLMRLGRVDEGIASYRAGLAAARARYGDYHAETLITLAKLGTELHVTGRRAEGRRLIDEALAGIGRAKEGSMPEYAVALLSALRGRIDLAEGRLADATAYLAIDLYDARENFPGSLPLANALRPQGLLDLARGRYADANRKLDEAAALIGPRGLGADPALRNRVLIDRARVALVVRSPDEALALLDGIVPLPYAGALPLRVLELQTRTLRAAALDRAGRIGEAIDVAAAALADLEASPLRGYYPVLEADAALELGRALRAAGRPAEARPRLERARSLRDGLDAAESPWRGDAAVELAACLADLDDPAGARRLADEARAIFARSDELGPQFTRPLADLDRRLAAR